MNIIRTALAIIFATLGILCIGLVPLSMSATESVPVRMNKLLFEPKADAAADRLIKKGIFTQEQHDEIREFSRVLYVSDLVTFSFAMGVILVTLGITLLSIAYSLRMSAKLATLSRRLKAEQIGGADRASSGS